MLSGRCGGLMGTMARVTGPRLFYRKREVGQLVEEVKHSPFLVQDGLRNQSLKEVVEAGSCGRIVVAGDCIYIR